MVAGGNFFSAEQVVKALSRGQKRSQMCDRGSEVIRTILTVCYRSLGLFLRYLAMRLMRWMVVDTGSSSGGGNRQEYCTSISAPRSRYPLSVLYGPISVRLDIDT